MPGTMTYVGFDVHARSACAAAIDVMSGELSRVRFGPGIETPVAWLRTLAGPVRACYEAGPAGYGLYRAAVAAGIEMQVIAPGLTPRGRGDRVKTDRKDAELLARCRVAGGCDGSGEVAAAGGRGHVALVWFRHHNLYAVLGGPHGFVSRRVVARGGSPRGESMVAWSQRSSGSSAEQPVFADVYQLSHS